MECYTVCRVDRKLSDISKKLLLGELDNVLNLLVVLVVWGESVSIALNLSAFVCIWPTCVLCL